MITGREPNILKCLPPEEQQKALAQQRKAEKRYAAQSEKIEQQIFSAYLKRARDSGKLWFISPRSDQPSTIAEGHPDYSIWIKDQCLLIEMKVEGGKLSDKQSYAIAYLEALGQKVFIAWNHLQAIQIVEQHLPTPHDESATNSGQIFIEKGT